MFLFPTASVPCAHWHSSTSRDQLCCWWSQVWNIGLLRLRCESFIMYWVLGKYLLILSMLSTHIINICELFWPDLGCWPCTSDCTLLLEINQSHWGSYHRFQISPSVNPEDVCGEYRLYVVNLVCQRPVGHFMWRGLIVTYRLLDSYVIYKLYFTSRCHYYPRLLYKYNKDMDGQMYLHVSPRFGVAICALKDAMAWHVRTNRTWPKLHTACSRNAFLNFAYAFVGGSWEMWEFRAKLWDK